jgi:hypothetical protein
MVGRVWMVRMVRMVGRVWRVRRVEIGGDS